MQNNKIVIKKVVSLTLGFSFLVMSVTGLFLYIIPKGRVSHWADWKMLGLNKGQYIDLHITSMVLFMVVGVWHIYYNWKPIVSYLKNSTKKVTFFKKEFLIALVLNILFVGGTLVNIQPFQGILDFGHYAKNYWQKEYGFPPYGKAEASSLKSFSKRINVNLEDAMSQLKSKGIKVESSAQTILEISRSNSVSPKFIYDTINVKSTFSNSEKIESLGRKTLGELNTLGKINLEKSIKFLANSNFEANSNTRMKKAANALDITPNELYKKIKALK
jgi:hypothetical protein